MHIARITDQPETSRSFGPFFDKFYAQRLVAVLDEQFGISPPCGGGLRARVPRPDAAERFLLGYDDGLVRTLQEEIERLSSGLQFERAATVRDQLSFCQSFLRRQAFVRTFASATLVVSEAQPPGKSEHYLFDRGRLVAHASSGIPATWQDGSLRTNLGPQEPQWVMSERALVVYSWFNTSSSRKSVQVLRETEAQNDRRRDHRHYGRHDAAVMGSQALRVRQRLANAGELTKCDQLELGSPKSAVPMRPPRPVLTFKLLFDY